MSKAFEALLKKKAAHWASDLTKRVKANAPKHLAPYVSSKSHQTGYGYSIVVSVKQVEKVSEIGAISNYGSTDMGILEQLLPQEQVESILLFLGKLK